MNAINPSRLAQCLIEDFIQHTFSTEVGCERSLFIQQSRQPCQLRVNTWQLVDMIIDPPNARNKHIWHVDSLSHR